MFSHVFASRHFLKMIGYFVVAALVTVFVGLGVTAGSILSGVLAAGLIGIVGLVLGLASTILLRGVFGLMQTGRIIQYLCFFFGTWTGVCLASLLFSAFAVTSSALVALIVFAIAFGAATLTGEVPTKGRTWLPMRMPKKD